jgi:hypothetical protein
VPVLFAKAWDEMISPKAMSRQEKVFYFDIKASDSLTFCAARVVLGPVALVASYVPMRSSRPRWFLLRLCALHHPTSATGYRARLAVTHG